MTLAVACKLFLQVMVFALCSFLCRQAQVVRHLGRRYGSGVCMVGIRGHDGAVLCGVLSVVGRSIRRSPWSVFVQFLEEVLVIRWEVPQFRSCSSSMVVDIPVFTQKLISIVLIVENHEDSTVVR